jgi:hypothetical protein
MGTRNRVVVKAHHMLHRLAESIPGLLEGLKIPALKARIIFFYLIFKGHHHKISKRPFNAA